MPFTDPYLSGYLDAMIETAVRNKQPWFSSDDIKEEDLHLYEITCMANLIHGIEL